MGRRYGAAPSAEDLVKNKILMLVKEHPVIYDRKHPEHEVKNIIDNIWASIAMKLNISPEDALKTYTALRKEYARQRGLGHLHEWHHWKHMQFLDPYIAVRAGRTRSDNEVKTDESFSLVPVPIVPAPAIPEYVTCEDNYSDTQETENLSLSSVATDTLETQDMLQNTRAPVKGKRASGNLLRENLLLAVKEHPAIYDKQHPDHEDKNIIDNIWGTIATQLSISAEDALKTYTALKNEYTRQRRVGTLHQWHHWKHMKFLDPHIAVRAGKKRADNEVKTDESFSLVPVSIVPVPAIPEYVMCEDTYSDTQETENLSLSSVASDTLETQDMLQNTRAPVKGKRASENLLRENLLLSVKEHLAIYDKQHPDHEDKNIIDNIWGTIATQLSISAEDALKTYTALKNEYTRQRRVGTLHQWHHWKYMKFLDPHIAVRAGRKRADNEVKTDESFSLVPVPIVPVPAIPEYVTCEDTYSDTQDTENLSLSSVATDTLETQDMLQNTRAPVKGKRASENLLRENLLLSVKEHPAIYDKKHPDHEDKNIIDNIWGTIATQLSISPENALKIYRDLRKGYTRERNLGTLHQWHHWKHMKFLDPHIAVRAGRKRADNEVKTDENFSLVPVPIVPAPAIPEYVMWEGTYSDTQETENLSLSSVATETLETQDMLQNTRAPVRGKRASGNLLRENLLLSVKEHPAIYDKKHPDHEDKNIIDNIWETIATQLSISSENALKIYITLRKEYTRQRGVGTLHQWHHWKHMKFLDPHIAVRAGKKRADNEVKTDESFSLVPVPIVPAPAIPEYVTWEDTYSDTQETENLSLSSVATETLETQDMLQNTRAPVRGKRASGKLLRKNLLLSVKEHPAIYDKKHPDHEDKNIIDNIWGTIATQLSISSENALKIYITLRKEYTRQRGLDTLHEWHHWKYMKFLDPHIAVRAARKTEHKNKGSTAIGETASNVIHTAPVPAILTMVPNIVSTLPTLLPKVLPTLGLTLGPTMVPNMGPTMGPKLLPKVIPTIVPIVPKFIPKVPKQPCAPARSKTNAQHAETEELLKEKLLRLVKEYPALYEKKHPVHEQKEIIYKIWGVIATQLKISIQDALKTYDALRREYSRQRKHGGKSKWHLWDACKFLDTHIAHRNCKKRKKQTALDTPVATTLVNSSLPQSFVPSLMYSPQQADQQVDIATQNLFCIEVQVENKMEFVPLDCIKQEPEESITEELNIKPDPTEEFTIPSSETLHDELLTADEIKQEKSPLKEEDKSAENQEDLSNLMEEMDENAEIASEVEDELGSELEKEDSDNDVESGHDLGEHQDGKSREFVLQDNEKNGEFVIVQNSEDDLSYSDYDNNQADLDDGESDNEAEFSGHFLAPMLHGEEEDMEYQPPDNIEEGMGADMIQQDSSAHKCEICDEVMSDQLQLIFHINEKHSDMCLISSDQLEVAVKANIGCADQNISNILPGNIKCKQCSCIFLTKIGLDKHKERFHQTLNVECPICFKVFKNNISFCFHLKTAHKSQDKTEELNKKSSNVKPKRKRKAFSKLPSESESSGDEYKPKESSSSDYSEDEDPTWTCSSRKRSKPSTSATLTPSSTVPGNFTPAMQTTVNTAAAMFDTKHLVPGPIVQAGSLTGVPLAKQQLQVIRNTDGSLKVVGGLLPGQQLLTLPDGTMKIVCTSNPLPPGTLIPVQLAPNQSINHPMLVQQGNSSPLSSTSTPTTPISSPLIIKAGPSTLPPHSLLKACLSTPAPNLSSNTAVESKQGNNYNFLYKTIPTLPVNKSKTIAKTYPGSSVKKTGNSGVIKVGTLSDGQVNVLLVDDKVNEVQFQSNYKPNENMQSVVSKIVIEREKQRTLGNAASDVISIDEEKTEFITSDNEEKQLNYDFLSTNPVPKNKKSKKKLS